MRRKTGFRNNKERPKLGRSSSILVASLVAQRVKNPASTSPQGYLPVTAHGGGRTRKSGSERCPAGNGSVLNAARRTSLMVQWLRFHLPAQGTQVQSLVQEDPTCCGATRPLSTSLHALEATLCDKKSHHMRSPDVAMKSSPHSWQLEKGCEAMKT